MSRKVLPECPNCHNVEVDNVTIDDVMKVGPFKLNCSDCKCDFLYLVEVEILTKSFPIPPESTYWRTKKGP